MSKQMSVTSKKPAGKAIVRVLGCKVNQAEAAAMAKILENRGYRVDPETQDPDLVLINTCCVTAKAEGKSRRTVGSLAQRFPHARIVVTGCLAEINPTSLQGLGADTVVLGTYEKDRFEEFADRGSLPDGAPECGLNPRTRDFVDLGAPGIPQRARAFLKVQDGCNQHCTYCIVPKARGRSRSMHPERVLSHAGKLSLAGHAEIVLTGIHLGSYGRDLDRPLRLEDLVEELLSRCPAARFRMSSIEPQEITTRLIDLTARHERLCSHFHIPLQSGDDAILKRMRRPYDAAAVTALTRTIIDKVPEACIGLDVMVGFPGEDERSFRRTVDLIVSTGAAYLHVFPFSPRPGTPAADFKPLVPAATSQERVAELRRISKELRRRFYSRFIGRVMSVVLESDSLSPAGTLTARTDNYIPVRLRSSDRIPKDGAFLVTLEGPADDQVRASTAPPEPAAVSPRKARP
ncbi:MAG: tRNA (N(6)-L-threonylcarbamoyladenosine(37)-C(2))-methylthiotransferase MtaB [Desulfomonilaceae bacterium]|nr:tRNA (N(6)-L-threonylcarbamoyladenosine(37)-C(2))-methylthiotransferase MtaB [Desulfomonilaceae bacterium]